VGPGRAGSHAERFSVVGHFVNAAEQLRIRQNTQQQEVRCLQGSRVGWQRLKDEYQRLTGTVIESSILRSFRLKLSES
jgi:hypothetical protein